jgi:hypothetical protein
MLSPSAIAVHPGVSPNAPARDHMTATSAANGDLGLSAEVQPYGPQARPIG